MPTAMPTVTAAIIEMRMRIRAPVNKKPDLA